MLTPRGFERQLDFRFTDGGLAEAPGLVDLQDIRAQCGEPLRQPGEGSRPVGNYHGHTG